MEFVNRNISGVFKILIAIIAVFVFVKILPLLVIGGVIVWAGFKGVKYFKNRENKKAGKFENIDTNESIDHNEDPFDFTGKSVVDVDYEEIKK
ncbi:hypothetical protein JMF89_13510 [Clostridiaceae bacterium UIB06]|nr:hypothetical protein [Clostridiaceae bacterium UIB06]